MQSNFFKPADLIFCGVKPGESSLILPMEQTPGEGPSYANHVAGFIDSDNVVEALIKVKRHRWFELETPFQVWRQRTMSMETRIKVAHIAESFVGDEYGWWKLLGHATDWSLSWLLNWFTLGKVKKEVFFTRRLFFIDSRPICSWVWAEAYAKGYGISFGHVPYQQITPDHMHDYVNKSVYWEKIYDTDDFDCDLVETEE